MAKRKMKSQVDAPAKAEAQKDHAEIARASIDSLAQELADTKSSLADKDALIVQLEEKLDDLRNYAPEPHECAYLTKVMERERDAQLDPYNRAAIDALTELLERFAVKRGF